jgi:hypothetical protein
MNEIAGNQRAYTESGPWDRLGSVLRITVAVAFLAITVVFIATAQNGLVSAVDEVPTAQAASTTLPANGTAAAN